MSQMARVFFSFTSLNDGGPADHRTYNEWHLYDHRPENLALDGVRWGDRWYRPTEYRQLSHSGGAYDDTDYVTMYWLREPAEQSLAEWSRLASDSFQWGRGPLLPGISRNLLAFFTPVRGYAATRTLVSADTIPFRPNRGLHVTLWRFADPAGNDTHDHHRWEDRVLAPAELEVPGVAGVWTFSFLAYQHLDALRIAPPRAAEPGSLRMHVAYLDADPADVTNAIRAVRDSLAGSHRAEPSGDVELLFSAPLRTIVPFQDW